MVNALSRLSDGSNYSTPRCNIPSFNRVGRLGYPSSRSQWLGIQKTPGLSHPTYRINRQSRQQREHLNQAWWLTTSGERHAQNYIWWCRAALVNAAIHYPTAIYQSRGKAQTSTPTEPCQARTGSAAGLGSAALNTDCPSPSTLQISWCPAERKIAATCQDILLRMYLTVLKVVVPSQPAKAMSPSIQSATGVVTRYPNTQLHDRRFYVTGSCYWVKNRTWLGSMPSRTSVPDGNISWPE